MIQENTSIHGEAVRCLKNHMHGGNFQYSVNLRDVLWFARRIEEIFTPSGSFVDIGGALSPVNLVLAEMGMQVHVVDFDINNKYRHSPNYKLLEAAGVKFINADCVDYRFEGFADESIDCVGSFHTFEHFHHSPRSLCEAMMRKLKPGGKFIVETPNAANFKKRLKLLCGRTNYLPFDSYYDNERYWLHIREYTIGDFKMLAKKLNFSSWRIFGLNYFGSLYPCDKSLVPYMPIDYLLRLRPGLCGSILLVGTK
jgi:SAM-dependent methyltransferase